MEQNQYPESMPTLAKKFKDATRRMEEATAKERERRDNLPKCSFCNTPLEIEHKNKPCPFCIQKEMQKMWEIEENIKKEQKKIQTDIRRLGGERAYKDFTLDKITDKNVLEAVKYYPNTNLFLHGKSGTGKTHLAVALIRKFPNGILFKPQDIFRSLRGKEIDEEAMINYYSNLEYMVIDDIGTEKKTDFSFSCLYEIIDNRWMNYNTGLIITSNLNIDDLALKLNDDRLTSRIANLCKIINLTGEDWRLRK